MITLHGHVYKHELVGHRDAPGSTIVSIWVGSDEVKHIGIDGAPEAGEPDGRRLALLLKFAWRACGLKCVNVQPEPPAEASKNAGPRPKGSADSAPPIAAPAKSRDRIAAAVGTSHDTLTRARSKTP